MEGISVESRGVRPRTPRAILDAGGEAWHTIRDVIVRRMDELQPGEVLEVISREPNTYQGLSEWCWVTGHELFDVAVDGIETRLWIRKW